MYETLYTADRFAVIQKQIWSPPSASVLRGVGRPARGLSAELLGVLRGQALPAELHCLRADDAADGSSTEKAIQDIETNVPPGSTHCNEGATDTGPQRQA